MKRESNQSAISGLKRLRTGAERHRTAPRDGSRTQVRKAELKSYGVAERKGGRARKVSSI